MENETDKNETYSFSRDIIERLLYGLVTILFCTAPFLIPGITVRQGGMLFFGDIIFLFLGITVFGIWVNNKKSGTQSKPRRSNH